MADFPGSVLVVVSQRDLRQLIGRVVEELNLRPILYSAWDASCIATVVHAEAVIVDLDDFDDATANPVLALRLESTPAPLIAVSRRTNVGAIAPRLGAVAGLRKPLDIGKMLETIGGVIQQ